MNREQVNIAEETPAIVSETPVGQQLRAARESLGLPQGDIAQTLKLGLRQIEALESGDWGSLPGQTFIRGFVRNYARLVHLDPAPLMAQLDRLLQKPVDTLSVPVSRPAAMPRAGGEAVRKNRAVALAGLIVALLAVLVYFTMPGDVSELRGQAQAMVDALARKTAPAPETPAAGGEQPLFPPGATPQQVMNPHNGEASAETPVAEATPPAAEPAAPPAESGVAVPVPQMRFVFDKESWLEVRDRDKKAIFSQRVPAGTEQSLSGNGPLSLVIGYAPGVRLFWRGQAVDLVPHTRGDVARLVLE